MSTTELLFNPLAPEFIADPYPFYHRLRAEDPVHQSPMGFWVLTRYDDVAGMLRDPRFGRKGFDCLARASGGRLRHVHALRDPPDHTWLRTLISASTRAVGDEHIQQIGTDSRPQPKGAAGGRLAYPRPSP
jgi:cytochrome P450